MKTLCTFKKAVLVNLPIFVTEFVVSEMLFFSRQCRPIWVGLLRLAMVYTKKVY